MILKVEVKRLLKEFIRQAEKDATPVQPEIKSVLEHFAGWLDNINIEKVIRVAKEG